jgi:hypothetical protein
MLRSSRMLKQWSTNSRSIPVAFAISSALDAGRCFKNSVTIPISLSEELDNAVNWSRITKIYPFGQFGSSLF